MKNTEIAIKYAEQMLTLVDSSAHLVISMPPGCTKHDVRVIKNGLIKLAGVDNVMIDRRSAVITKK